MKITDYAVRNSQFTLIVCACLVALGVISFRNIPRMEDPAFKVPFFSVLAVYPGANATDIEQLVVRPLEDSFKELDDLDQLRTTVKDGYANIRVEFLYGVDADKSSLLLSRLVTPVLYSLMPPPMAAKPLSS